jgi:hypothetical protein
MQKKCRLDIEQGIIDYSLRKGASVDPSVKIKKDTKSLFVPLLNNGNTKAFKIKNNIEKLLKSEFKSPLTMASKGSDGWEILIKPNKELIEEYYNYHLEDYARYQELDELEATRLNRKNARLTNAYTNEEGDVVTRQDLNSKDVYYQLPIGSNVVDYALKIVNALGTDKVQKLYDKFYKNNRDKFYNELVPLTGKQQVDILREWNIQNNPGTLQDMLTGIMAELSYTVEVNTAKGITIREGLAGVNNGFDYGSRYDNFEYNGDKYTYGSELEFDGDYHMRYRKNGKRITRDEFEKAAEKINKIIETPTQHYANLTVPGGTNYTENEIATPGITPSIQSHAAFKTDSGVGWFRSDEQGVQGDWSKWYSEHKDDYKYFNLPINQVKDIYQEEIDKPRKTRRVLELQSDLFQKGRDNKELVDNTKHHEDHYDEDGLTQGEAMGLENLPSEEEKKRRVAATSDRYNNTQNQFLQLLNKDGNWVPFFIKTIIQDSAKKGYEKVLFPTGDTASKVEGHTTLQEFKNQKEKRIKELQSNKDLIEKGIMPNYEIDEDGAYIEIDDKDVKNIDAEIKALREELKRVESEGIAALKPIYNFYENRVYRELEKMYTKEGVTRIKDEYGNEWYEVEIVPEVDLKPILLQKIEKATKASTAPIVNLDNTIKKFVTAIGGNTANVTQIVVNGKVIDAVAVADTINKTIQVADGRADETTLPEEAAHLYLELLPENSLLLKEMLRDIRKKPIYQQVLSEYGGNPAYQNEDGSVNELKIAKEAIGKQIAGVIVKRYKDNISLSWWKKLWRWVAERFKGKSLDSYTTAARDILNVDTSKLDKKAAKAANEKGQYYFQLEPIDKAIVQYIATQGTEVQNKIVEDLVLAPGVFLDKDPVTGRAVYRSSSIDNPRTYTSFSRALAMEGPENPEQYEINRQWGIDFDSVLKGVILGYKKRDIVTPTLPDSARDQAYDILSEYLMPYKELGYVALPQVVVYDDNANLASAIDLLLVSPTGALKVVDLKSSWSSIRNPNYTGTVYDVKDSSRIKSVVPAVTKLQQHNIQINTYNKLLQLMGYQNIQEGAIKNMQILFKTFADGKSEATGVKEDNTQIGLMGKYVFERKVPLSAEEAAVDAMVPVDIDFNKNRLEELGVQVPLEEDVDTTDPYTAVNEELTELEGQQLDEKALEILQALRAYYDFLISRRNSANDVNERAINNLSDVIVRMKNIIENEPSKQAQEQIYTDFLGYLDTNLAAVLRVLKNTENRPTTAKELIHTSILAEEFVNRFSPLSALFSFTNKKKEWRDTLTTISTNLAEVQDLILAGYRAGVYAGVVKEFTANEALTEAIVQQDVDISATATTFIDLSNSRSAILENLDKKIKDDVQEAIDRSEALITQIDTAGDELMKAHGGKIDASVYDKLFERDSTGKKTGRFINAVGPQYWDLSTAIQEDLLDEDGEYKQYIKFPKTQAELDYNIELAKAKRRSYDFMAAELPVLEYDSMTGERYFMNVAGEYHEYDKEFLAERNKYMRFDSDTGQWVPKANNREYIAFREKYYDSTLGYYQAERDRKTKDYTGQVTFINDVRYFVKGKYVNIRTVTRDGKFMGNKEYEQLKNSTDPKDVALWKFFSVYRDILLSQQQDLPPYTEQWFNKNNIPRVQANWLQKLTQEGTEKGKIISSQIKNFFDIKAYKYQQPKDLTGSKTQSLPVLFMGRLQSQILVTKLEDKLAKHIASKRVGMSAVETRNWNIEKKKIEEDLKIEKSKITAEDIEPDLVTGLKVFVTMAQNFAVKRATEDAITATKKVIENMTFTKESRNFFDKVVAKTTVAGKDSNTYKRLVDYLQMNYYSNSVPKSFAEAVADRIMNFTSVSGLGFNIFSWANNSIAGMFNNQLDSYGDQFYKRRALNRMKKEVTISIGNIAKHKIEKGLDGMRTYTSQVPVDKYEALTKKFNMVEHMAQQSTGRVDFIAKLGGYYGQDKGEWMVQSMVGNAILDSIQIEYKGTDPTLKGTKKSIYDAFDFNEKTKELELQDGFELSTKEIRSIINRIRETNKRIHGNYRAIDKVVIEKEFWGKLLMQYHKWVVPAFSARFRRGKFDENLGGGMYIEGRWRSVTKFLKAITNKTITIQTILDSMNADYNSMDENAQREWLISVWGGLLTYEEWNSLSDEDKASIIQHRRANLMKDLMDLVYIALVSAGAMLIGGLAAGLDDDDEYTKRVLHYLEYQADRSVAELALFVPGVGAIESYQLIKNPIASMGTIRDFAELASAAIRYPFIPEEDAIIKRGPNKGKYKVAKEFGDIVPIIKQVQRWYAFDEKTKFWIR